MESGAVELGIGFVAYSPLGRGFLSGRFRSLEDLPEDDVRGQRFPRFARENFDKNLELVGRIEEIAAEKGATPGQLAIAWVLHQGDDVVPIPGTKQVRYLEENLGAAGIELTPGDLDRIEEAMPKGSVFGARYAEAQLAAIDSDD